MNQPCTRWSPAFGAFMCLTIADLRFSDDNKDNYRYGLTTFGSGITKKEGQKTIAESEMHVLKQALPALWHEKHKKTWRSEGAGSKIQSRELVYAGMESKKTAGKAVLRF